MEFDDGALGSAAGLTPARAWPDMTRVPVYEDVECLETLLYYDGPQMVTLRVGRELWLALAVEDRADQSVRWLDARASRERVRAMTRGDEPVRHYWVTSDEVRVVDRDPRAPSTVEHWRGISAFSIAGRDLPDAFLSAPDAFLPFSRKRRSHASASEPEPSSAKETEGGGR